jgi:lipid-binding SYLF domain-containing protein
MSAALALAPAVALAADRTALERDARAALQKLTATVPAAKSLSGSATAVLVFPKITKAGLGIGGQYGDGVLLKSGKVAGFYNTSGASYGLQAGAQQFGYAMFLMNDKAISALGANDGFEVGVGPSIVVMDEGKAKTLTTTTAKDDIYAFTFGQKGLMGGVGLQGNKITRLKD